MQSSCDRLERNTGTPRSDSGEAHAYDDACPMFMTNMFLFCTYSRNHTKSQLHANGLRDRSSCCNDISWANEAMLTETILFRARVSICRWRNGAKTSGFQDLIALRLRTTVVSFVVLSNMPTGSSSMPQP